MVEVHHSSKKETIGGFREPFLARSMFILTWGLSSRRLTDWEDRLTRFTRLTTLASLSWMIKWHWQHLLEFSSNIRFKNLFNFRSTQDNRVAQGSVQSWMIEDPTEGRLWNLCKYTNSKMQVQIHNPNTQIQTYKYKYININTQIRDRFKAEWLKIKRRAAPGTLF